MRREIGWRAGLVTALLILALPAIGDEPRTWLGVPVPDSGPDGRAPLRAVYDDLGMSPLSLRLPKSEDKYTDIAGATIYERMKVFCDISEQSRLAGDPLWGRISGTRWELAAAEYVEAQFKEFGLEDVRIEKFPRSPQWWPAEWELTLIGPGGETFTFPSAYPASPSPSTPPEGLEAELAYVGLGRPVDVVNVDLRGKIAVVHSAVWYSTFSHTARGTAPRLIESGAAGVITLMNTPGNLLFHIQGTGSPDAPAFTLGGDDGEFLENVITKVGGANKLRARMQLKVESKEGWQAQNTYGVVRGEMDEYIVITAHLDAYFQGASDNASGLATMLTLAEHFGRRGAPKPRRNLLFVATGGHHAASVGAAHVVSDYPEVMKKTVLVLNCEHTAAILLRSADGRSFLAANTESPKALGITNASPLLTRFMAEALDRYGVAAASKPTTSAPGDAGAFIRAGMPVVQLIESNFWYHASGDTPETITPQGLERTARAYAMFIDLVNGAARAELEGGVQ